MTVGPPHKGRSDVGGRGLSARLLGRLAPFFAEMQASSAAAWVEPLECLTRERLQPERHGDLATWGKALERLPVLRAERRVLDAPCVEVSSASEASASQVQQITSALESLHPWRKGPFCLHGVRIDAEWRSDLKWERVADAITPLAGRTVLDVGCGNGYYGFRALGAGAELVLGIDPTLRFVLQFLAVNRLIGADRCAVLPLSDDDLPALATAAERCFDTLFSMGVLYHRRDPVTHLERLRRCLRHGGELVLESLVVEGEHALIPRDRYARMRNVHLIPTVPLLRRWLESAGFGAIRVADFTRTTTKEQRATPWMRFQSLADFLDPQDAARTVEGYPAPARAVVIATRLSRETANQSVSAGR